MAAGGPAHHSCGLAATRAAAYAFALTAKIASTSAWSEATSIFRLHPMVDPLMFYNEQIAMTEISRALAGVELERALSKLNAAGATELSTAPHRSPVALARNGLIDWSGSGSLFA